MATQGHLHDQQQRKPLKFGSFRLDRTAKQLWRGQESIELEPRPFAVLEYLVQRPGQLVSQDELLAQLWAGTYVTRTALRVCIRAIRRALDDAANQPRYIETVARQGYRFIGDVSHPQPAAVETSGSLFVGREAELQVLQHALETALRTQRQVVFVTGEAGVGKTALVDTFRTRLSGSLLIGRGQCLEQYGGGEAYLPVLDALTQLGQKPENHRLIPVLDRYAPTWLAQMPALVPEAERVHLQSRVTGATRPRMLREMAEALEALTAEQPLLLILEDLHWSDPSTLELIAYMAQRREPAQLLILGTYRPTDLVVHDHPLKKVKQELHAHGQCEEVRLELLSQDHVEAYLRHRLQTQQLPARLLELVYQRTDGNPLFMVNIVDYALQQRVLSQTHGQWRLHAQAAETQAFDIPPNLQQFLIKQFHSLDKTHQLLLETASVCGVVFAVASVAAVLGYDPAEAEQMCEELARTSPFVEEDEGDEIVEWPDGSLSGQYRFRHALYQHVLYERLAAIRKVRLHRQLGEHLEASHGEQVSVIAAQLAVHFEAGRAYPAAVRYLQQAAQNALQHSAHQEALGHVTRGLQLLETFPDTPQRTQQELALQVALGSALQNAKGYGAPEVEAAYARARTLCHQLGNPPQLFPVLYGLQSFYLVRADMPTARELAERLLALAAQTEDPSLLVGAHMALGQVLHLVGQLDTAYSHAQQGIRLSEVEHGGFSPASYIVDPGGGCLQVAARILWLRGYPNQALQRTQQALQHAQAILRPFHLGWTLTNTALMYYLRREASAVKEHAQAVIDLSTTHGFPNWLAWGNMFYGWALSEEGHAEEGCALVRQSLATCRAIGSEMGRPWVLSILAEMCRKAGQFEESLAAVDEALELMETNSERIWEAELYRLKGELLLNDESNDKLGTQNAERQTKTPDMSSVHRSSFSFIIHRSEEAEACFQRAISIARMQQAKSLELRAVVSLARLWQQQEKKGQARHMLADVYNWFTEGFETADLQEAKALLGELA